MDSVPHKRCSKCGETKRLTEFHKCSSHRDGLSSRCCICAIAVSKQYAADHPTEISLYQQHKYQDSRPQRLEYRKRHYQNNRKLTRERQKEYRDRHREELRSYHKQYYKNHRERVKMHQKRRESLKRQLPATFTPADWEQALEHFNGACAYCRNPPSFLDSNWVLHQEHHISVTSGGGYTPDNIIPACQSCNLSKGNKSADEWCVEHFGQRKAKAILARIEAYFEWVGQQDDQENISVPPTKEIR